MATDKTAPRKRMSGVRRHTSTVAAIASSATTACAVSATATDAPASRSAANGVGDASQYDGSMKCWSRTVDTAAPSPCSAPAPVSAIPAAANSAALIAAAPNARHARAAISANGNTTASCGLIASSPINTPAAIGRLPSRCSASAAMPAVRMLFWPNSADRHTAEYAIMTSAVARGTGRCARNPDNRETANA